MDIKQYLVATALVATLAGCGGSGSSSPPAAAKTGQVLLGPLSGAVITAYKLSDPATPIEGPLSSEISNDVTSAGAFALELTGVPDATWVLVTATGGNDIDADDNGVADATPTPNKGTIHALATAAEWRSGGANVTVISEISWIYAQDVLNDEAALKTRLDSLASKFIKTDLTGDGKVDAQDLASFTPRTDKEDTHLDYTALLPDDDPNTLTLIEQIHAGHEMEALGGALKDVLGETPFDNMMPTAVAGEPQSSDEESLVTLSGTASDTDGSIVSYAWTQQGGSSVVINNPDQAVASFTAPTLTETTVLNFQLTVTDDGGESASDSVSVTVNPVNATPAANAGPDQVISEQTAVVLTGSGTDNDGTVASYQWTQVGTSTVTLSNANQTSASFIAPALTAVTTLTFQLEVTDNEGGKSTDTVAITVNPVNAAPAANAGTDQTVNEQTAVTLAGSGSDGDGTIINYHWTPVGSNAVTLSNANQALASFTAPTLTAATTLTFQLEVTDNEGGKSTDTVVITVNPVNEVPVANAGSDQSVEEQLVVALTGSGSDDGSITSYLWTQVGTGTVELANADQAAASFTAPTLTTATILTFQLEVTDNEGASSVDTVAITVNPVNLPPTVNAGADQTDVKEETQVTLNGTASDADAKGAIVSYLWTQTDGTPVSLTGGSSASASFTAPTLTTAETLTFALTVTDNEETTATDSISIVVNPVNLFPTVDAGSARTVAALSDVVLTGVASDTDGDIDADLIRWTQVPGDSVLVELTTPNQLTSGFTAPAVPTDTILHFQLSVTDNEGGIATSSVVITVSAREKGLTVSTAADFSIEENKPVELTGTANDSNGTVVAYRWQQVADGAPRVVLSSGSDFVNGTMPSASFTAPTVKTPQNLTFELTVKDDEDFLESDRVVVSVLPVNVAPLANAGSPQTIEEQGLNVTLNAEASSDSDGAINGYLWEWVSGPAVSLTNADKVKATFKAPRLDVAMPIVFKLTVTDDEGGQAESRVTVTVNKAKKHRVSVDVPIQLLGVIVVAQNDPHWLRSLANFFIAPAYADPVTNARLTVVRIDATGQVVEILSDATVEEIGAGLYDVTLPGAASPDILITMGKGLLAGDKLDKNSETLAAPIVSNETRLTVSSTAATLKIVDSVTSFNELTNGEVSKILNEVDSVILDAPPIEATLESYLTETVIPATQPVVENEIVLIETPPAELTLLERIAGDYNSVFFDIGFGKHASGDGELRSLIATEDGIRLTVAGEQLSLTTPFQTTKYHVFNQLTAPLGTGFFQDIQQPNTFFDNYEVLLDVDAAGILAFPPISDSWLESGTQRVVDSSPLSRMIPLIDDSFFLLLNRTENTHAGDTTSTAVVKQVLDNELVVVSKQAAADQFIGGGSALAGSAWHGIGFGVGANEVSGELSATRYLSSIDSIVTETDGVHATAQVVREEADIVRDINSAAVTSSTRSGVVHPVLLDIDTDGTVLVDGAPRGIVSANAELLTLNEGAGTANHSTHLFVRRPSGFTATQLIGKGYRFSAVNYAFFNGGVAGMSVDSGSLRFVEFSGELYAAVTGSGIKSDLFNEPSSYSLLSSTESFKDLGTVNTTSDGRVTITFADGFVIEGFASRDADADGQADTLLLSAMESNTGESSIDTVVASPVIVIDPLTTDVDGDGVLDINDAFPVDPTETLDTDGDGIGNNADTDKDGDGVPDINDAFPLDKSETLDTDADGIGDNTDPDIDGDTVLNAQEVTNGTDPLKADTDGDGVNDALDFSPLDPSKSAFCEATTCTGLIWGSGNWGQANWNP